MNTTKESLTPEEMELYKHLENAFIAVQKVVEPTADLGFEANQLRNALSDYLEYYWISATEDQQDILRGHVCVWMAEFTKLPGSRFRREGPGSAEEFRDDYVIPEIQRAQKLNLKCRIDLSNCAGFSWPFLEELFGGLSRKIGHFEAGYITEVVCRDDHEIVTKALQYMSEAWKSNK